MTDPAPSRPTSRRSAAVGDVVGGLLAIVAIIGLLVGVPSLLLAVIGMPIGDLVADLADPLSSDNARAAAALRLGLSAVVWLAWLQVAWALMVELAAAARGRAAPRSRLVVPAVQRSARNLVAAAMLLFTTFTAPASAATLPGLQLPPIQSVDVVTTGNGSSTGPGSASDPVEGYAIGLGGTHHRGSEVTGGRGGEPAATEREPGIDAGPRTHYTVRPADTLWSIAEDTTGDGFAWRTIRDLNLGRVMSDGSPITAATEALTPGTVLVVPGSSKPTAAGPGAVAEVGGRFEVDGGDHFWALAEETLAEKWGRPPTDEEITPYWREMIELNRDRLRPPSDPDLIFPGQQFLSPPVPGDPLVPGVSDDVVESPSEPPPESAAATGSAPEAVPGPTTTTPSVPLTPTAEAPPSTRSASRPSSAGGLSNQASGPSPSSAVGVPQTHSAHRSGGGSPDPPGDSADEIGGGDRRLGDDKFVPLGVVAITGLGLLTAAVARIIRRRQSQRMGMRPGGRSPDFSPPIMAEQLLTSTADEQALDDLDSALRHVGAELERADMALPELVGTMVGASSLRLLLGSRHDSAPAPFRSEGNGTIWTAERPITHGDVRRAQAPYPALVTMGHTAEAQLLIDLECVGVVNLIGGLADVIDTMGTMAFELATSPLADTIEVVCVGFGEELGDLERITVVPTLDAAIDRIEAHAGATADLVADTELSGPQGRASAVGDWTPLVVFDPLSDLSQATERLLVAVGRTSAGGVSAVVTTGGPDALEVKLTENRLSIPAYDVRLSRRVLTRAQRAELAAALADATDPRHVDRPDLAALVLRRHRAAASEPRKSAVTEQASSEDASPTPVDGEPRLGFSATVDDTSTAVGQPAVVVRLLGPLRVETGDGETIVFDRSATPEFLAYLTHHRRGVGVDQALNTLWPATTARRSWIANVHADARRTLAEVVGVEPAPRAGADNLFELSDLVANDLELFRRGVEAAVDLPVERAVEVLAGALELVEGVPYTNVTNRWPTVEGHWQEATMLIDEAARCAATLALDHLDDPRLASWAAAKGLLASPHSVALHRLRLQAAIADGDDELGPDAVFQHYQATVLADEHRPEGGANLDPAIVELYESYRRSRMGTGAGSG